MNVSGAKNKRQSTAINGVAKDRPKFDGVSSYFVVHFLENGKARGRTAKERTDEIAP
jgi:hypothetical protein